ncbi:MAG: hypothetical protein R6U59_02615 [Eubacteriales bacterium]
MVTIKDIGNIILKSTDGPANTEITGGIIFKGNNTNVTIEGFTIIPTGEIGILFPDENDNYTKGGNYQIICLINTPIT